jgi:hypothetical protein
MSEQKQEPACPACGKAMVLSREIKREDIGAVLLTFECRLCRVSTPLVTTTRLLNSLPSTRTVLIWRKHTLRKSTYRPAQGRDGHMRSDCGLKGTEPEPE